MRIRRISGLMPPAVIHPVELYGPEKARGTEPIKPPEPEPEPEKPADWTGHAKHRRVEDDLQGSARQAELQPSSGKQDPLRQILASARRAGLNQTETLSLRKVLTAMAPAVLEEEQVFLRTRLFRSSQPLRALRAYLQLLALGEQHPGRLTRKLIVDLSRSILESAGKSRAAEDFIKPREAVDAVRALIGMTEADHGHAFRLVESVEELPGRLRILRALAGMKDSLTNPAINDLFRNMCGMPGYFLAEVTAEAAGWLSRTGELQPEALSGVDTASVEPGDYLREGFFDENNRIRGAIFGYCSIAMARRCRLEGTAPEDVRTVVDVLSRIGEDVLEAAGNDPDFPLDASILFEVKAFSEPDGACSSVAIKELLTYSLPWLQSFRDLAALTVHMERILSHLV